MRVFPIFLIAVLLWACARQPEIRGAELDALAEELIQYAAERTDLEPLPPPRIEFVESIDEAFRDKYPDDLEKAPTEHRFEAAYEYGNGVIYLENRWKPYQEETALLLHELVHYMQHVQGKPACRETWEREAYEVQRQWMNEHLGLHLSEDWVEELTPVGCS